jgi:hypothetical protein
MRTGKSKEEEGVAENKLRVEVDISLVAGLFLLKLLG